MTSALATPTFPAVLKQKAGDSNQVHTGPPQSSARGMVTGEEMFADYGEGFTFEDDSVCLCHQCGHGGRNKPR